MSLRDRVNPHILDLQPYVPGKPPEAVERELGIAHAVKMASNENPLGPCPSAVEAMREALEGVNRYPDGASFELRAALSERLGVDPAQLVFGCGGDEILELVAKTFLSLGDEVVYAWPSFAMYPIVTRGMGATPVPVPLNDALEHDLPAMAAAVTEATKLVVVCNPNNPTGTSVGKEAFDHFVEALPEDVILLVDEAYYEFVRRDDFPDSFSWLTRRPGTIVLRTFSKIFGLAGMRVGYGVCDTEAAGYLERARHPFNVNRLAEIAAVAALRDHDFVARTIALNSEGAEYLTREIRGLGLEVWPTDANFLLVRGREGLADDLLKKGVIVRPLGGFGMADCVRISIGRPEENERVVKELRALVVART